MKKALKPLMFSLILLGSIAFSQISFSQAPPPPPSGSDKGGSGNKAPGNGGGAPIEGGVIVALTMAAGFGGWKLFKSVQEKRKTTVS
ncbi:MAG: hypothetical protein WCK09_06800 [Bacteroidota bacterium]